MKTYQANKKGYPNEASCNVNTSIFSGYFTKTDRLSGPYIKFVHYCLEWVQSPGPIEKSFLGFKGS